MINTMISIPVHEKTEVVIDQIVNYKHFCPHSGIVLHISKSFNYKDSFHTEKEFLFILSTFENVFVNPTHLDTGFADIVHTHVSNFDYVSKIVDFEYFCMVASNELFVRNMPEIVDCDINCGKGQTEKATNWAWYNHTFNDNYLKNILDYLNGTKSDVKFSQIEGSFYKKDIFEGISDVINRMYNYNDVYKQNRIIYPREEVYYPTIAYLLNNDLNNLNKNFTLNHWQAGYLKPSIAEINDIARGAKEGIYSVKRVSRIFNDIIRFHIGNQIGHYRDKSMDCIKIKFGKMSRNLFNLVSGRRRIFIGHAGNENLIRNYFKIKTTEHYISFKIDNNNINLAEIVNLMKNNQDALFIIFINIYPHLLNILLQQGFRENIDFIDGNLLMD